MNRRGFLGGLLAAACTAAARIYPAPRPNRLFGCDPTTGETWEVSSPYPNGTRAGLPSPRFRSINEGIETVFRWDTPVAVKDWRYTVRLDGPT